MRIMLSWVSWGSCLLGREAELTLGFSQLALFAEVVYGYAIVTMPFSCSVRVSSSKTGPVLLEKPGSRAPSDLCAYSFAMIPSRTLMMHCTTLGSCFFCFFFALSALLRIPSLHSRVTFFYFVFAYGTLLIPGYNKCCEQLGAAVAYAPYQRISYSWVQLLSHMWSKNHHQSSCFRPYGA